MKTYNKIEMVIETSPIDMEDHLMVLEKGDILVVRDNKANWHFVVRSNDIGGKDIKVTSCMAASLCANGIAKIYEENNIETNKS